MVLSADKQRVVDELKSCTYPVGIAAEADMVMKGGITSGVVYPLAVCELAKTYRFRNLGGSSAGGIAAAFAAAAEANRAGGGFNFLATLPDLLGKNLANLFVPSKRTKPVFDVLLAAIDRRRHGTWKLAGIAAAVVRAGWLWFTVALSVVLLTGSWALLLAAGAPHSPGDWGNIARGLPILLLLGLGAGMTASAGGLLMRANKELPANGHGLCRGSRGADWPPAAPADGVEPFTDWMHAYLNRAAGRDRAEVLTMGDLWGAGAVEQYGEHVADGAQPGEAMHLIEPVVRLEMMTTNVTHCRPARLPFADRSYLFCPTELRDYVPAPVLAHLIAKAHPSEQERICPDHGVRLLHLPDPPDFPVALAVRMTLSFPVLISAVPLYAVDFSGGGEGRPVRCWFSDGGISSNFPIHFFDALWPGRPTFGISLGPYHPDHPETDVYLPTGNHPRVPRVRPTQTLPQFFAAILDTLQNWSDEGQSTLPGYRDRIVDIHHLKSEGGLNLTMDEDTIASLAWRGYLAGQAFGGFEFARHRWTRYLTAMSRLDDIARNMQRRYDAALPAGDPGYRAFLNAPMEGLGYPQPASWRAAAVVRTDLLLTFVGRPPGAPPGGDPAVPSPDFTSVPPKSLTDLRITPHF